MDPYERQWKWLDGRMNVALVGGRWSGGCSAGRCVQQAVEEIAMLSRPAGEVSF